ncbi:MAG TPA: hypothetical protein VFW54_04295 [Propionibacteriaceae bacterium]|nr:hypothetical protein [Propionibacteriaceae bacterium]
MRSKTTRALGCLVLALILLIAGGVGAFWLLRSRNLTEPVPGQQRCVATANNKSAVVDLEQAHFASIIAGVAVRRGLPPRAASIALATAYQETGIRNLDYGDQDSVGLFQQRPSQGWGTKKQLMDPDYAAGKFYDALVKINNWQTDDINDVAQQVQRSGHPEAYNDHETDARVLASALTGQSPAGFSCLDRSGTAGDTKGLRSSLQQTFGNVDDSADGSMITIRAGSTRRAWAYAHYAVANASLYGVTTVKIKNRSWQTQDFNLPDWQQASPKLQSERVEITVRGPSQ